jgi:hypothetical protein
MMKKIAWTLGFTAVTMAASIAFAGQGGGPGCADGTATDCQHAKGAGMGMHGAGHGAGYQLMTPEERTAHRTQMQSLKSLDECNAYLSAHHAAMAARAAEKGVTLTEPPVNACERMKAHGRFG